MTQLGYVHCDLGEYVEAGKVLQQAADSAEGSDLDGRFWRTLGRVHYLVYEATADSSHLEKAQSAYQEALRRIENLGNPSVWFETARVYVRFGAYEGALEVRCGCPRHAWGWDGAGQSPQHDVGPPP